MTKKTGTTKIKPAEKRLEHFSYHNGWDAFRVDAGTVSLMLCKVCGSKCDVERNVSGPQNYTENMAQRAGKEVRKNDLHDCFRCPNAGYPWHGQAVAILQQAYFSPSNIIAEMLKNEAEQIVLSKHATKEIWL